MTALPLPAAAAALAVSVPTLKRWLRAGAPVARRGRRGRGRATLICPDAVAAWRASNRVTLAGAAAAIPDVLASALVAALAQCDGLPKQRMAGFVAGCWYAASVAVMDHLRAHDPGVPDVDSIPLEVERLRRISAA